MNTDPSSASCLHAMACLLHIAVMLSRHCACKYVGARLAAMASHSQFCATTNHIVVFVLYSDHMLFYQRFTLCLNCAYIYRLRIPRLRTTGVLCVHLAVSQTESTLGTQEDSTCHGTLCSGNCPDMSISSATGLSMTEQCYSEESTKGHRTKCRTHIEKGTGPNILPCKLVTCVQASQAHSYCCLDFPYQCLVLGVHLQTLSFSAGHSCQVDLRHIS